MSRGSCGFVAPGGGGRTFGARSATTGSQAVRSVRRRWPSLRRRCYRSGSRWPVCGPRKTFRGRLRALPLLDRSTRGDCRQCLRTAVVQRVGVPTSYSASVANRSVTCPTRLETRTKESNMCASHWARTKPRGAMKVKAFLSVGPGRILASETARGALPARLDRSVGEAAQERTRWDPKDGELCLSRTKPEETLVEVRSDSDVQIDRQTWV